MSIDNEILEVINKNLPNLHAQQLGKILTKATEDANEVIRLNDLVSSLNKQIMTLKIENSSYESLKGELDTIERKKNALNLAQLSFDISKQVNDLKVECEKEKTQLLRDTFSMIFKSPSVKELVNRSVLTENTYYDSSNRACQSKYPQPVTETKTVEFD